MNGARQLTTVMLFANPSQKRRCRRLMELLANGLMARGDGASLAHVLWLFVASLLFLIAAGPRYGLMLVPVLALFLSLAATSLFDALYLIVPDRQIAIMLISGSVFLARLDWTEIAAHVAAGFGAWGLLTFVAFAYERVTGRSGLGAGDAKLFGAAGLWLGLEGLPSCLMAAVASALVSAAIERRAGAPAAHEHVLPFGPHLALGFWLALVFGSTNWLPGSILAAN